MLAYVFWHWRRPEVGVDAYEQRLGAFQQSLADAPPAGLHFGRCLAVDGVPWANRGQTAYEDWYLLGGSADLDPLNDAAISASRQRPHDEAAAAAAAGVAGLYRLRSGTASAVPSHAYWFDKPRTVPYRVLVDALDPVVRSTGGALWIRHMTLGPATEFCLHAPPGCALPESVVPRTIPLRAVWPRGA
jgi:hypothetical protein